MAVLIVSVLLCGGALSACGTDKEAQQRTQEIEAAAKRKAQQAAAERRAKKKAEAEARNLVESCEHAMGEFQDSISELDSRLNVGLSYDEYTDKLGDVQVTYDQVDYDELDDNPRCLSGVGVPLESALNQYLKAANIWSDCFDDVSCSNDSIQGSLQLRWAKASAKIRAAKNGMDDLGTPRSGTS
ncbi:hypothetical protein DSM104329_02033 [Capillimicrobium parvum]|uniref:Lipoprotein n=1 Tax=Capillimicrobium parvum TaxID=2884022 RepID=A0A9E7C0Q6_9ACTN|nr:hypothetical protein DSM104329_02033 [Capillimicrobium parvum]